MNIYKITYDYPNTWICVLASDIPEAISIFFKHVNKYKTTKTKIISIETITSQVIYDSSKMEKDSYNEGYKAGIDNFYADLQLVYNNLK